MEACDRTNIADAFADGELERRYLLYPKVEEASRHLPRELVGRFDSPGIEPGLPKAILITQN